MQTDYKLQNQLVIDIDENPFIRSQSSVKNMSFNKNTEQQDLESSQCAMDFEEVQE